MSNIKELIRAEIKKRRLHFNKEAEKYKALNNGYSQNCYGARDALRDLENFLDTLPDEPASDELEEAAEKFARFYDNGTCDGIAQDCFKAGAEWQKKQIPMPEDTVIFQKGVQEGKRLMMEGAVEGYVTYGSKGAYVESDWLGTYDVEVFGTNGNKVKIIIVKEEEK